MARIFGIRMACRAALSKCNVLFPFLSLSLLDVLSFSEVYFQTLLQIGCSSRCVHVVHIDIYYQIGTVSSYSSSDNVYRGCCWE